IGQLAQLDPAPIDELRLMAAGWRGYVDLALFAGETQGVPLLLLSAIFPAPGLADDVMRDVVIDPIGNLAELLHRTDVRLLVQFPQRGRERFLAFVDAALRHLPDMRQVDVLRSAGAASDEDASIGIEHRQA